MTKEKKKLVTLVCMNCGNELTASPGMAKYAVKGKGLCVKCAGTYTLPKHALLFGEVGEDGEIILDPPEVK